MKRDLFSLKGRVVCLTGGTGLIGKAVADALLDSGATLYVGARSRCARGNKSRRRQHLRLDMASESSIAEFMEQVTARHGRIDALVNCAWPRQPYGDCNPETIRSDDMLADLQGHLLGYFNCCRHAFGKMKAAGRGSMVNLGSIYGELAPDLRIYRGTEIRNNPTYALIKAGVHMLTKYFAVLGAARNVRANTVAPGGVFNGHSKRFVRQYADRVPMGRMARAEEVAGAVIFLASEASSYVTGQVVFVDGGMTAW